MTKEYKQLMKKYGLLWQLYAIEHDKEDYLIVRNRITGVFRYIEK